MAYWLFVCAGLVFGVVVVGGITRLTESGLSMVDWSLLHFKPPSSEEEWHSYFEKYKQSPEYILLNDGISLGEFKKIYYMEYSHRMLGRLIGAAFLFPLTYFILTRRKSLSKSTKISLTIIGSLILFQGFLGWYMVKSGLDPEIIEKKAAPRVSHYRLAAHLTTAFAIYLLMLRTGLSLLNPSIMMESSQSIRPRIKDLYAKLNGIVHLVGITAISGAFVAGLDAGLIYNTFPKMGLQWIPDDLFVPNMLPLNNPTFVQFFHRALAISSISYISFVWLYARRRLLPLMETPSSKRIISRALNLLMGAGMAQVGLGIFTLLWIVPVPLAAMHQAGSMVLLTTGSWALYVLKRI
ncbi:Cytochrome c oxidase assembly protein cox15 [Mitosporidium daphniae]